MTSMTTMIWKASSPRARVTHLVRSGELHPACGKSGYMLLVPTSAELTRMAECAECIKKYT